MSKIRYIGKSLVITEGKYKILVLTDLHIGKGAGGGEAGNIISKEIYAKATEDIKNIFGKIKQSKVDEIVILGDLKHTFSKEGFGEREDIVNFIDLISKYAKKTAIIKGNHDNFIESIIGKRKEVEIRDFYIINKYCFLHGDRDFPDIYSKEIKYWIMGHLHPSINLSDGAKNENYKCFIEGEYRGKNIIILPSFVEYSGGINIKEDEINLAWEFDILNFNVKIVSDDIKTVDFGKLKTIK